MASQTLVAEINGGDARWVLGTARDASPAAEVGASVPGEQEPVWIVGDRVLEF